MRLEINGLAAGDGCEEISRGGWIGLGSATEVEAQRKAISVGELLPRQAAGEFAHKTDSLAPGREIVKRDGSGSRGVDVSREGIERRGMIFDGEDEFPGVLIFGAGGYASMVQVIEMDWLDWPR